jgi:hypothetical protein
MRTLLAKCCVLALIAGGFVFTGDIGRVFTRGRRVLEATTIPEQVADPPGSPAAPAVMAKPLAPSAPVAEAPSAVRESVNSDPASAAAAEPTSPASLPPADAPIGIPTALSSPPALSPESIDLAALGPGDRIVVWVGRRGGRKGAAGSMTIAFDVIDPAAGEVLEQRHTGTGEDGVNHSPFRRIRILGSATEGFLGGVTPTGPSGRITRRQSLRLVPVDATPRPESESPAEAETIGPVQAMTVVHATTTVP